MRRKVVKRSVGLLAVLTVAGVLLYEITKPRSMHEVIEAVTSYSLALVEWSRDWPRIVAVCHRYPVWVFKVVKEQSGKEWVIGYGELNERTLELTFSEQPSAAAASLFGKNMDARLHALDKGSWSGELSEEEARARVANFQDIFSQQEIIADEDISYDGTGYPHGSMPITEALWHVGVKRGWFKADERSVIVIIYNEVPFDGRLDFIADASRGDGPPPGSSGTPCPTGWVNARTLEIELAFID